MSHNSKQNGMNHVTAFISTCHAWNESSIQLVVASNELEYILMKEHFMWIRTPVTRGPSSVRAAVMYLKTARARVVYLKISKRSEGGGTTANINWSVSSCLWTLTNLPGIIVLIQVQVVFSETWSRQSVTVKGKGQWSRQHQVRPAYITFTVRFTFTEHVS